MLKVKDMMVAILVRTNLPTRSKQKQITAGLHFLPQGMLRNTGRASSRTLMSCVTGMRVLSSTYPPKQPDTMCTHTDPWWSSNPASGLLEEKQALSLRASLISWGKGQGSDLLWKFLCAHDFSLKVFKGKVP